MAFKLVGPSDTFSHNESSTVVVLRQTTDQVVTLSLLVEDTFVGLQGMSSNFDSSLTSVNCTHESWSTLRHSYPVSTSNTFTSVWRMTPDRSREDTIHGLQELEADQALVHVDGIQLHLAL